MKIKKIRNLASVLAVTAGIIMFNPSSASAAWKHDGHGWWNTEGSSYSIGWRNIDNTWYYFDSYGYMKTGWAQVNGTWYYLSESGAMKTGWINSNNLWYYLDNSGAMKTGWINDKGTWYYTNTNGAMHTGLLTINNNTYYLNQCGAMTTGDVTIDGIKYTFATSGEKIFSVSVSNNTDTSENNNISDTSADKVTSGGGGGGSLGNTSSAVDNNNDFKGYSDLHGDWRVDSYIKNSGMTTSLPNLIINSAVTQEFTVTSNKVSSSLGSISNPSVNETVLTNSEFSKKFGTSLSKLGISGDKVNCITVSSNITSNNNKTAYIITSSSNDIYAIADGAAFKLSRA